MGVKDSAVGAILEIPAKAMNQIRLAEAEISNLGKVSERTAKRVAEHWGETAVGGLEKFITALRNAKGDMEKLGNININLNTNGVQTQMRTAVTTVQSGASVISDVLQKAAQSGWEGLNPNKKPAYLDQLHLELTSIQEVEHALESLRATRKVLLNDTDKVQHTYETLYQKSQRASDINLNRQQYSDVIGYLEKMVALWEKTKSEKDKALNTAINKQNRESDKEYLDKQAAAYKEIFDLKKKINDQKVVITKGELTGSKTLEKDREVLIRLQEQLKIAGRAWNEYNTETRRGQLSENGSIKARIAQNEMQRKSADDLRKTQVELNKAIIQGNELNNQPLKARLGSTSESAIQRQLNTDYKEMKKVLTEIGEIRAKYTEQGRSRSAEETQLIQTLIQKYRVYEQDVKRLSGEYANLSAAADKAFQSQRKEQADRNAVLLSDAIRKAAQEQQNLADKKAAADAKELQRQSEIGRRRNEQYHKDVEAERMLDEQRKKAFDKYERMLAAKDKAQSKTDADAAIHINDILTKRIALEQQIVGLQTKRSIAQIKDPSVQLSYNDETRLQNAIKKSKELEDELGRIPQRYAAIAEASRNAFNAEQATIAQRALEKVANAEAKVAQSTQSRIEKSGLAAKDTSAIEENIQRVNQRLQEEREYLKKIQEEAAKARTELESLKGQYDKKFFQSNKGNSVIEHEELSKLGRQIDELQLKMQSVPKGKSSYRQYADELDILSAKYTKLRELISRYESGHDTLFVERNTQKNIDSLVGTLSKLERKLIDTKDANALLNQEIGKGNSAKNLLAEYKQLQTTIQSLGATMSQFRAAGGDVNSASYQAMMAQLQTFVAREKELRKLGIDEIEQYRTQRANAAYAADVSAFIQAEAAKTAEAKKQVDERTRQQAIAQQKYLNSAQGAMWYSRQINKGYIDNSYENRAIAIRQLENAIKSLDANDKNYEKTLRQLTTTLNRLKKEQKDVSDATKPIVSSTEAINAAKTATNLKQLETAYKMLKEAMSNTKPDSTVWNQMNTLLGKTKTQIDDIKKKMGEFQNQTSRTSNILGQLKGQIAGAFSVAAIQGFIKKMVETRAQFELQRVALGAIIQDVDRANKMFLEIQQMALMSPFSIMQLEKATKQVAAFGFETEKIVPTMKMVADLGAGLGVELDRIVLVMGHLKARGYLEGTMVRQFTNMGFNVLGELAKYYSELEDKMVSVAEVQTRVKKKMVEFADVEEVLKRVTSAGGMFYDMQKKQADSIWGQMQRITDAYDLMLNEIGKDNTNAISKALTAIRSLISHWRMLAPTIKTVGWLMTGVFAVKAVRSFLPYLNKLGVMVLSLQHGWRGVADASARAATSMKMALSTTGIGLLISALASAIAYFAGVRAEVNALKEELDRIGNESVNNLNNAIVTFKTNADVISDQNKTYLERAEAMKEISRVFSDILPKEKMEMDYIAGLKGNYEELIDIIQEYYKNKEYQQKYETVLASQQAKDVSDEIERTFKRMNKDNALGMVFPDAQLKAWAEKVASELNTGKIPNSIEAMGKRVREIFPDAGEVDQYFSETYGKADFSDVLDKVNKVRDKFGDISLATSNADNALEMYIQRLEKMDFNQLSNETEKIQQRMGSLAFEIDKYKNAIKHASSPIQKENDQKKLEELIRQYNEYAQRLSDVEEAQIRVAANEFYKSVETETKRLTDLVDAYWTCKVRMEDLEKQGKKNTAEYRNLAKQQRELRQSADELKDEFTEVNWELVDNAKTSYELKGVINDLANKAFPNVASRVKESIDKVKLLLAKGTVQVYKFAKAVSDLLPDSIKSSLPDFAAKLGLAEKEVETLEGKVANSAKKIEDSIGAAYSDATARNVEKFGARLERINTITKDSTKTAKDMATELRNEVKSWEERIKAYDTSTNKDLFLKANNVTKEEIDQLRKDAAAAEAIADEISGKEDKKSGGKGKDKILELWKNRLKALQDFYKQYEDLQKNFSDSASLEKDRDAFTKLFKTLDMDMDAIIGRGMDKKGLAENIDVMLAEVRKVRPELADEFEKAFADTKVKIDVELQKDAVENMKKDIQNVADNFELSETFRKLGVSTDLVFMLGGKPTTLADYKKYLVENYQEAVKNQEEYGEEGVKAYDDMLKKITDLENKNAIERSKNYIKYLTESLGERAQIEVKAMREIAKIREDETLDQFSKEQAIMQKRKKMQEDLNKVDLNNLKSSDVYISVFKDLENASREQLQYVINKLRELQSTFKDLSPAQVKSIANDLKKLQDAMAEHDSFKSVGSDIKAIIDFQRNRNQLLQQQVLLQQQLATAQQNVTGIEVRLANERIKLNGIEDKNSAEYKEQEEIVRRLEMSLRMNQSVVAKTEADLVEVTEDINDGESASERFRKTWEKINKYIDMAKGLISDLTEGLDNMGLMTDSLRDGLESATNILGNVQQIGAGAATALNPMADPISRIGGAVSALGGAIKLVGNIFAIGDKKKERQIKKLQERVEDLDKAYDKLHKSIEDAYTFDDYNAGYKATESNLAAQKQAYQEMIRLEESKKKTDKEKVKQYTEALEEIAEKEEQLRKDRLEAMGSTTDYLSEAQSFVDAWLEAYKETGDGLDALTDSWEEFIENLFVKQGAAQVVSTRLKKVIDTINTAIEKGGTDFDLAAAVEKAREDWSKEAETIEPILEQLFGSYGLGKGNGEFVLSDLQKGIQNITEPQAAAIEAYLNSMRFAVFRHTEQLDTLIAAISMQYGSGESPMLTEVRGIRSVLDNIYTTLRSVIKTQTGRTFIQVG